MLDNIATVDNPGSPLRQQIVRALQNFAVTDFATTANEYRHAAGGRDHLVIELHVIRGIRLDDIGPEFSGLAHKRNDFLLIAIHHVTAGLLIGLEDEWLHHHRHTVAFAGGF